MVEYIQSRTLTQPVGPGLKAPRFYKEEKVRPRRPKVNKVFWVFFLFLLFCLFVFKYSLLHDFNAVEFPNKF